MCERVAQAERKRCLSIKYLLDSDDSDDSEGEIDDGLFGDDAEMYSEKKQEVLSFCRSSTCSHYKFHFHTFSEFRF